jgi:hypothetical protein
MWTHGLEAVRGWLGSDALGGLYLVYLFRVLPFVVYAAFKARRMLVSLGVLLVVSALLVAATLAIPGPSGPRLCILAMALAYHAALTASLHVFALSSRGGALAKAVLFCVLFVLCIVVPAKALPLASASLVVIIAHGFELTLAAYSYCVALWAKPAGARMERAFFFMLVTPEIVYPLRGSACPPQPVRGLGRALIGAAIMAAALAFREITGFVPPSLHLASWKIGLAAGGLGFALLYANHSALAHLQIGLCRMVGYAAPERYALPFAAATPGQFWMRWNRYFGLWLRCYVYTPLVRMLHGRGARAGRVALATIGSFFLLGVFHDLYWFVFDGRVVTTATVGFVVWGSSLCAWKPIDARLEQRTGPALLVTRELSRIGLLCGLCFTSWIFL